jgi:hypothetical protein
MRLHELAKKLDKDSRVVLHVAYVEKEYTRLPHFSTDDEYIPIGVGIHTEFWYRLKVFLPNNQLLTYLQVAPERTIEDATIDVPNYIEEKMCLEALEMIRKENPEFIRE